MSEWPLHTTSKPFEDRRSGKPIVPQGTSLPGEEKSPKTWQTHENERRFYWKMLSEIDKEPVTRSHTR